MRSKDDTLAVRQQCSQSVMKAHLCCTMTSLARLEPEATQVHWDYIMFLSHNADNRLTR